MNLKSRVYPFYFVGLSHVVFMVSAADRAVLSLLVEPIRADLALTDLQVSLLGGLAFSLFYALCAIPIGRLIDAGNRVHILAAGVAVWTCATMGTAFATAFVSLFLLRMLVAVGETTTSCAVGMVTDMFLGRAIARMVAVVMLGATFGVSLALIGGGYILERLDGVDTVALAFGIELKPWQIVFLIAGLPGLILVPLLLMTTREVPRRRVIVDGAGRYTRASFAAFFSFLREHKGAVMTHAFGYSLWSIADKSLAFWAPTYLVRAHDLPVSSSGYVFGSINLSATIIGNLLIAWLVDRAARNGRLDAAMRVGRNAALLGIVPICLFPFMPTFPTAVAMLTLAMFTQSGYSTVVVAQQMLAPNQVRAQYTAMYLLASNIIAGVIGMSLVALLSEYVFKDRAMVGFSIAVVCGLGTAAAAVTLSYGLKHYRRSMAEIDRQTAPPVPPDVPVTPSVPVDESLAKGRT